MKNNQKASLLVQREPRFQLRVTKSFFKFFKCLPGQGRHLKNVKNDLVHVLVFLGYTWKDGGDGHEEGIKGVDLGCELRRVGVRLGIKYNQTAIHIAVWLYFIPTRTPTLLNLF